MCLRANKPDLLKKFSAHLKFLDNDVKKEQLIIIVSRKTTIVQRRGNLSLIGCKLMPLKHCLVLKFLNERVFLTLRVFPNLVFPPTSSRIPKNFQISEIFQG